MFRAFADSEELLFAVLSATLDVLLEVVAKVVAAWDADSADAEFVEAVLLTLTAFWAESVAALEAVTASSALSSAAPETSKASCETFNSCEKLSLRSTARSALPD
jgi:AcrR family transcriptional regulator